MTVDRKRVAFGAGLAIFLVFALWRFAGLKLDDLNGISFFHAGLALLASAGTLFLRASNYRVLAAEKVKAGLRPWLDASLRHQFLFAAIPFGLGDIGFPVLARRYVGLNLRDGAAVILLARARDLCILPALGLIGLALLGYAPALCLGCASILFGLALFVEPLLAPLGRLFRRPELENVDISFASVSLSTRLMRSVLTICSWLFAACALWCAYRAAGLSLNPSAAVALVAGLNLLGVVALTVGGLGVAEAGSTGMLVALGFPLEQAAQASIVGRPVLLISVLGSCLLWWGGLILFSRFRQTQVS